MNTDTSSSYESRKWLARMAKRRSMAGFSLAEVSMALGIIAIGFVTLLGLWPAGLDSYRRSIDTTVSAQIAQRVISELQESDFDYLIDPNLSDAVQTTGEFYRLPVRYFDDQGNELTEGNRDFAIYHVYTRGSLPGRLNPSNHGADWFTALPGTSKHFNPRDLTILTVQIVANPQNIPVTIDEQTLLIDRKAAREANLSISNHSAAVARNGRPVQL